MKQEWQAVQPLFILLALTAALLLVIAGLLSRGWGAALVPPPERAAEQLVSALGAHRYAGAMNQLSQELRQQIKEEDLRALVIAIEQSPQKGIQDVRGKDAQEQGSRATASVRVKLGSNQETTVELPLVKERQVWKISSLEPLRSLGQ